MRTVAIAGAALVLAATGCGSGTEPADSAPSTAPTSDGPETGSATPTGTPAETPATTSLGGPVMRVQGISMQLPKGYRVGNETPVVATASGRHGIVVLGAIAGPKWPLDRMVEDELRQSARIRPVRAFRRLPDTTLDGFLAYHFTGRLDRSTIRDAYGTWDDGYQVVIRFDLDDDSPLAQRRELIESVVATYDSPTD
jgi:hypothetical protein